MTLRTDAFELLETLKEVIGAMRRFEHPNGSPYATEMVTRLEPVVADFEHAIVETRDKDAAAVALDKIGLLMHDINGAATKGDLRIFPRPADQTLNAYWRLNTIFRASRSAKEPL